MLKDVVLGKKIMRIKEAQRIRKNLFQTLFRVGENVESALSALAAIFSALSIFRLMCSHPELTEDHVLTSEYLESSREMP